MGLVAVEAALGIGRGPESVRAVQVPEPMMSAPMGSDPRSAVSHFARYRDVDGPVDPSAQPPKLGGAVMAQLRPGTAGQNGRHQLTVAVELPASHRIDAAMYLVQTTVQAPLPDRGGRPPEVE